MTGGSVKLFRHPPQNFRTLVGYLAGLAAEKVILGTTHNAHLKTQDILFAKYTATRIDHSNWADVMLEGKAAAERFARANRAQIEAIAKTLLKTLHRRGDVDGDVDGFHVMARLNQLPPLTAIPPRDLPRSTRRLKAPVKKTCDPYTADVTIEDGDEDPFRFFT